MHSQLLPRDPVREPCFCWDSLSMGLEKSFQLLNPYREHAVTGIMMNLGKWSLIPAQPGATTSSRSEPGNFTDSIDNALAIIVR
jgi:hypothetical protein